MRENDYLSHHGVKRMNDELKHYGVIGMKWGVLRSKIKRGSLDEENRSVEGET